MTMDLEVHHSFQSEFKTPEFSPQQITELRGRLGQSRADFARAFGVTLDDVYAWEGGTLKPSKGQLSCMARLHQHADEYSEKTAIRPVLECALRERKVDQIHSSAITLET